MIKASSDKRDLLFSLGKDQKFYSLKKMLSSYVNILCENNEVKPLTMNEAQEKLFFEIVKCIDEKRPVRFVILKARQLGFSTLIAAIIFVLTMFQPNRKAVIVAHVRDSTNEIFKMYKRFYDYLPQGLKARLKSDNAKEIQSAEYGSSIRVLSQGDGVARGSTVNYVHLSEAAFYSDLDGTLTAILQSLHISNLENMLFIESTANGFNSFKDYYDLGCQRTGVYSSFFYPWFMKSTNVLPYDGFVLTPYEEKLKKEFNLTNAQIAWWRYKWIELKRDTKRMMQENPSRPSDAFISTGNSVFDNETIAFRKEQVLNLTSYRCDFEFEINALSFEEYRLENVKRFKTELGNLTVYQEPIEGHPYVIGIDPARGKGIDETVFQIIDNSNGKQVAIYNAFNEDNDISAAKSILIGEWYNNALLVPETNSTDAFTKFYMKANYRNVYRRETNDSSFSGAIYEIYGVKTGYNKKTMVDIAVSICREFNYQNISDFKTLSQMESFVYEESQNSDRLKAKGSGKSHDDCVMALLIAYYGRQQETGVIQERQHDLLKKKYGFDPLDLDKDTNEISEVFQWDV